MLLDEEVLKMFEDMQKTAMNQVTCDRCGCLLGDKVWLRITKVIFTKEIVCDNCNTIRGRNAGIIRDSLMEVLDR
jgi:hypothetical protein